MEDERGLGGGEQNEIEQCLQSTKYNIEFTVNTPEFQYGLFVQPVSKHISKWA